MSKQREEFEKAYAEICQPIVRRPYPIGKNGEYIYEEIHKAYLMWQQAQKMAVPDGFVLVEKDLIKSIYQSCNNALSIDVKETYKGLCMAIIDDTESMIEAVD